MSLTLRDKVLGHIRANGAQVRIVCFLLSFWLVWAQASNISRFFAGFLDGMSGR
ncbi:hypothetical protein GLA29479_2622 [Lysobacter antibioticus]|jgi:hypothetical protein|uniref:Uncharacterized protein n=1 Tax=Lysobacter antibioticus TaxID=84531 RepID=A0A0S2F593_LYSAN|nr:hypothetical protein [Lysobacter antibioticus]ALN63488.1 hypothetical protein GLA29479_2622 [Lysobacter antibioticus]ALN78710.1 hypothetical protein LA76x_0549 [Lysobacter antibioticus]